jgi:16S rRNA (cytidine1402-2'-O)-methyltransferase
MLYLVPTPIGNLSDMTFRAVEVLRACDLILAEDTRTSGIMLKHFNIENAVRPFHSFNEHKVVEELVAQMKDGKVMALISDAGTPGISDPGFLISHAAINAGVKVSCLPGPTSFVPALVASGLPCDKFFFEGFLPHKKGRQSRWKYLANFEFTFILFESPHRLIKCLEEIIQYCGPNRLVCVAREISKMYEDIKTLPANEMLSHYKSNAIKGEIVLAIQGKYHERNEPIEE